MKKTESLPQQNTIQAWAQLIRVSVSLLERIEVDLKTAGMPPLLWYDALLELNRAAPDGLRPFQLQNHMLLAQYNLSRLLDRLEKASFIERCPYEGDGRGQVLHITASGRDLLKSMWPVYRKAITVHFGAHLNDADIENLVCILGKLEERK